VKGRQQTAKPAEKIRKFFTFPHDRKSLYQRDHDSVAAAIGSADLSTADWVTCAFLKASVI
jgi:hypothetical protein